MTIRRAIAMTALAALLIESAVLGGLVLAFYL
jgi:hypothetical protein